MDLWFEEYQTKDMVISCRVLRTLHQEKTPFQELAVLDTVEFGRMLVLDDVIQTTIKDEFVYHEMITHVALNTHAKPVKVLIIGGGDGGAVREVVKHQSVEKVVLCEIDGAVVEASKKYLPEISCALENNKAEIVIDDGIKHVRNNKNTYDIIIIDSTDPVGPAEGLFSAAFYKDIFDSLNEEGIFVAQTESPFFNDSLVQRIFKDVSGIFPLTRLFLANVPSYPGGLWTFTMGSKKYDPLDVDIEKIESMNTKYYSPAIHRSCFILPPFVKKLLG
ncbi:MAG: Spermidine synthase [Pelotomaculum sp. PtaB.Bin013]|uniref:Polyamine aminopropyltransferase n=1 Tax=Pelotomaculum isophthalicicum JI TaxID=947010 RepID=A0A9X4H457_9FIRM|nr:polyamine aminopropyltransferase [Pelotomaculum isophthalicicum]MDF9409556.1 polyamine aminopropyltransferase [Pelotomaculum isophthalicicum JI]OPX91203.1 MAG: Spermidine synthase [Pelotomaculum sp. PtaB.Bin013]